jgi:hypothetical protein
MKNCILSCLIICMRNTTVNINIQNKQHPVIIKYWALLIFLNPLNPYKFNIFTAINKIQYRINILWIRCLNRNLFIVI